MDLEIITLSDISQTEKDKYMISLICGVSKIVKKTYLENRNTDIKNNPFFKFALKKNLQCCVGFCHTKKEC